MLKNKAGLAKISAIILIATSLLTGCNDDPTSLGSELLPKDDIIKAEAIVTYPEFKNIKNRVRTDNFIGTEAITQNAAITKWFKSYYGILGSFIDPTFGQTTSSIVTEVSLFSGREAFNERKAYGPGSIDLKLFDVDYIKLYLAYAPMPNNTSFSWYGSDVAEHKIKVYELSQRISNSLPGTDKYYNDASMEGMFYPEPLAELNWKTNNIKTNSTNDTNLINITLSAEFARKIFNLSSEDLKDKNFFKNAFHGFYITVDNPTSIDRSLIKLDLLSPSSRMELHYHKKILEIVDALGNSIETSRTSYTYTFPINADATMYNLYNHQHEGKIEFETTTSPYLYVQNMAGSYVNFNFSDLAKNTLDSIENSDYKYGISSVELVFEEAPAIPEELNLYLPRLTNLIILEKDENGQLVIPKFELNGKSQTAFYNNGMGIYTKNTIDGVTSETGTFSFKMNPDYFLKLAKEETPLSFYLRGANAPGGEQVNPEFNFNRTVLYNTKDANKKPKFIIKYVRYK